jgi:hypothetical protein
MSMVKKAPGAAGTFLRFAWQQLRHRKALQHSFTGLRSIAADAGRLRALHDPPRVVELRLDVRDMWRPTGITLTKGQVFTVLAGGTVWISKPLSIGASPATALWSRIGKPGPMHKMLSSGTTFEAWADGELELCLKPPGEWSNERGDFDPAVPRKGATGSVDVAVALWRSAADAERESRDLPLGVRPARPPPSGWSYLWRLGEGSIYAPADDDQGKPCIHVHTHGDVGILQYPIEAPLDDATTLEWRWRVDRLPSALPEHIQPTHDYLSIAVEFENGQDLTYLWSAELPVDTVFKCPLPWWSSRETHWVVRSGSAGLGQWQFEKRSLKTDYASAVAGELPSKIVRVWLIANSVFQRRRGEAKFADIALNVSGARQQIV